MTQPTAETGRMGGEDKAFLIAVLQSAVAFAEDELAVRGDEDDQYDQQAKPLIGDLAAALKRLEAA